ncbi:MAG: geranylgeranyl reductase family protein [Planctomycetota bacterium]|jgi:geranylgeranyl reductase family protein
MAGSGKHSPPQRSPDSLPDETWDAVVVGAGPAGATCAAHLADRGRHVVVLDRARFPREKVCGDSLSPDALRRLERLGVLDEVRASGHALEGVDIYSPSRIHLPLGGQFVTIRRRILDAIVARRAVRAGAAFCLGAVETLRTTADGVVVCSVAGNGRAIRARAGVIATGAELALAALSGMAGRSGASGVGLRCYVRSRRGPDRVVVSNEKGLLPGYAWIFPMGGREYNVGVSVFRRGKLRRRANLRREFDAFVRGHPAARVMMEAAECVTPLRGGIIRCGMDGARAVGEGNVIAIGETVGASLPCTGEGIGPSMETGELAAEVIDDALGSGDLSHLRRYGERIETDLRPRYAGYLKAESWLARPWLNDLLARIARHSRIGREAAGGMLSDAADPADFFSLAGLVRVLRS